MARTPGSWSLSRSRQVRFNDNPLLIWLAAQFVANLADTWPAEAEHWLR